MTYTERAAKRELASEILRRRRMTPGQPIHAQPEEQWHHLFSRFRCIQEDGLIVTKTTALHVFLSTVVFAERSHCARLAESLGLPRIARQFRNRPAPVWRQPKAARPNGGNHATAA